MRRLFLSLITLSLALVANAVVIDNNAGSLEAQITDHDITQLTITGTIDARDFSFIANSLPQLKSLDLSQAQIVAYSDSIKPLAGTFFAFPAGELPATILMGCEIDSLALPQSLTSIGHAALAGCTSLTTLELPQSLTAIGSYAFSGSGIAQVTVPASVITIGEGAWAHCGSLTTAQVNVQHIPSNAFKGDTMLCNLTLGEDVNTIGQGSFNGCSALNSITMTGANNITTIGNQAFIGAGVQAVDLNSWTALKEIQPWAFASSGITDATLPLGVESLGTGAFFDADSLTHITLPEGITTIPSFALTGNDTLRVVTLPQSINYLGDWAMARMTALDTINAQPSVVPALGDSVWAGVNQPAVMLNTTGNDIANLYALAPQWQDFHILRDYLLGDVNLDGVIDIDDINAIISYMMSETITPFSPEAANVNLDGVIDIDDINAIIDIMLGGAQDHIRMVRNHTR